MYDTDDGMAREMARLARAAETRRRLIDEAVRRAPKPYAYVRTTGVPFPKFYRRIYAKDIRSEFKRLSAIP